MTQVQTASTAAKRSYRDSDTVKAARLEREQRLIQKRTDQAARLKKMADEAAAKLAKTHAKAKEIETNEPKVGGRVAKDPAPILRESSVTRFTKELAHAAKEIAAKHGLSIDEVSPKIVHRGTGMSVSLRGGIAGVKHAFRKAGEASREALRFMANHKLIGLNKNVLGREVELQGETGMFKVIGLKGRTNQVVLYKEGSAEMLIDADKFKNMMSELATA